MTTITVKDRIAANYHASVWRRRLNAFVAAGIRQQLTRTSADLEKSAQGRARPEKPPLRWGFFA
jgi:hypothetical protein